MLEKVLTQHYSNYIGQSVENIKRDAKGLLHIISDYEGRVVFELLQNAFDRAEKNIAIIIKNDVLYVTNDGYKFSYILDFDYENGINNKRGDFQSICSVYTSTKTVAGSIGNKGIGFKSVFSIAENQDTLNVTYPSRYVEIFTQGVFNDQSNLSIYETCGFRLFEMIRSVSWLQPIADEIDIDAIGDKIVKAQREYPDCGLPGYYYPMKVEVEERPDIKDLLERFVTVVAIPLEKPDEIKALVRKNLVDNNIHFHFVQLKYPKPFTVQIIIDDIEILPHQVDLNTNLLVFKHIQNDTLQKLAQRAGLEIEDVSIGIYLRNDNKGRFYNYLPTDVYSPFPYVDFHADFRTTLNRKNINWDGTVGDYNKALLRACMELLFSCWGTYEQKEKLHTKYIKPNEISCDATWSANFFDTRFNIESLETLYLRDIFQIKDSRWNLDFKNITNLLSFCVKQNSNFKGNDYYLSLYKVVVKLCEVITSDYRLSAYSPVESFMDDLVNSFIINEVECLPGIFASNNQDIFYAKEPMSVTSSLNIRFTSVQFSNSYSGEKLQKAFRIKDYNDINEVLKHFKQCTYTQVPLQDNSNLDEAQQIEIIKNVFGLYRRKNENDNLFFERYSTVLDANLRENNSSKNQANFSVATLFLKVKNGRYKPAQLCNVEDLDLAFINQINVTNDFLSYIGVSSNHKLNVFDLRIYNKYKDGLDYLPCYIKTNEVSDHINQDMVRNCYILSDSELVHPALFNDNYHHLFSCKRTVSKELRSTFEVLRVKKYNKFSKDYFDILFEFLKQKLANDDFLNKIRSFYPLVFELLHKAGKYLVYNGAGLEFVSISKPFFVLKTKTDLDFALQNKIENVLLYEADKGLFEVNTLEIRVIKFEEELVYNETSKVNLTAHIQGLLVSKLPYILCEISKDNQSERNYFENDYNLKENLRLTKFYQVKDFQVLKKSEKFNYQVPAEFKIKDQAVFLAYDSEKIKAKALAKLLFDSTRFSDKLEIILFHREQDELSQSYDQTEINILRQRFDQDYIKIVEKCLQIIKGKFPEIDIEDHNWNTFDSDSIKEIVGSGKLDDLQKLINELRFKEEYKEIGLDFTFTIPIASLSAVFENTEIVYSQPSEMDLLVDKINSIQESRKEVKTSNNPSGDVLTMEQELHVRKIKNFDGVKLSDDSLESIGTNGEHEVLHFFVDKFRNLSSSEKTETVNNVFHLIKDIVVHQDYYENVKSNLIAKIQTDDYLADLITLLYITERYKYAYFDLVGFDNGKAFFVEVKTSGNNYRKDFFISRAEIECALKYDNYQLVRVTPDEIKFLGNPILAFKDQLQCFANNSFKLTSIKYKIELIENG